MNQRDNQNIDTENTGIALLNERSLHSSIKEQYLLPGDMFEVKVDNFIIDIVRDNLLIEIQTKNFSSIGKKLRRLVDKHNVLLIYPIPMEKWIVRLAASGDEIISRRKSPKKGKLIHLFDELVYMPDLINEENFMMEVLMIREEEIRCEDGQGSWRRKGVSIKDRILLDVVEKTRFENNSDFLKFVPKDLTQPFTNKSLAECSGIAVHESQKITYCLKKMGAIKKVGKIRNELLFEVDI